MLLRNKRILITGADGFIGSHLTEMLIKEGAQVRALSLYNSLNFWGWLEEIECLDEIEVVSGDIRDPLLCRDITKNIDVIFNLAALIAIPYSYKSPYSYLDTNIKGSMNLCIAAMENHCEKIIHTSTSEVYGTAKYVPIDELHPLQPQSPYSASKIGADMMALSFHKAYKLPLIIARPFNTYGPRQSTRAVIPTIITQLASSLKTIKLGDIKPTRDFNFVYDTCRGIIEIAKLENSFGEIINIGSNTEISIGDLFQTICTLMDSESKIAREGIRYRPEKSEVFRLWCNNDKITSLTGYKPEYTLEKGLKETIKWYAKPENLKKFKIDIYNL